MKAPTIVGEFSTEVPCLVNSDQGGESDFMRIDATVYRHESAEETSLEVRFNWGDDQPTVKFNGFLGFYQESWQLGSLIESLQRWVRHPLWRTDHVLSRDPDLLRALVSEDLAAFWITRFIFRRTRVCLGITFVPMTDFWSPVLPAFTGGHIRMSFTKGELRLLIRALRSLDAFIASYRVMSS